MPADGSQHRHYVSSQDFKDFKDVKDYMTWLLLTTHLKLMRWHHCARQHNSRGDDLAAKHPSVCPCIRLDASTCTRACISPSSLLLAVRCRRCEWRAAKHGAHGIYCCSHSIALASQTAFPQTAFIAGESAQSALTFVTVLIAKIVMKRASIAYALQATAASARNHDPELTIEAEIEDGVICNRVCLAGDCRSSVAGS